MFKKESSSQNSGRASSSQGPAASSAVRSMPGSFPSPQGLDGNAGFAFSRARTPLRSADSDSDSLEEIDPSDFRDSGRGGNRFQPSPSLLKTGQHNAHQRAQMQQIQRMSNNTPYSNSNGSSANANNYYTGSNPYNMSSSLNPYSASQLTSYGAGGQPSALSASASGMMGAFRDTVQGLWSNRFNGSNSDQSSSAYPTASYDLTGDMSGYSQPYRHGQSSNSRSRISSSFPFNSAYGDPLSMTDLHGRPIYTAAQQEYMDYVTQDPTKTAEELKDLLENIRPDVEIPPENREGTPEAMKYPLMEHQKLGLTWLKNMETGTNKGGILADDMGLGKTIQALALLVSRPSEDPKRKTTLIVAPVALLRQWEKEIKVKLKSAHTLSTLIYHSGTKKKGSNFDHLREYDVVLTTYGTLGAEYKRMEQWRADTEDHPNSNRTQPVFPLLGDKSKWYRVILDEAQCIKNPLAQSAKAACHLHSLTRFCLTGTPMMNGVHELYSLIRFLRIKPYNEQKRFNEAFGKPLKPSATQSANGVAKALKMLQALLKAILLRRTKKSEIDGRPILNLLERTNIVEHAVFNEDESNFYAALESKSAIQFNKYIAAGSFGKNYSNILVLLLRMRQACCHPHLIQDMESFSSGEMPAEDMIKLAAELAPDCVERIKERNDAFECPICFDATDNPAIFVPCGHDTCSECFVQMQASAGEQNVAQGNEGVAKMKCPSCRGPISKEKTIDYVSFRKVYMPETFPPSEIAEGENGEGVYGSASILNSDSDAESDVSTDNDSSTDSDSETESLDGFIVGDEDEDQGSTRKIKSERKAKVGVKVKKEDIKGKGKMTMIKNEVQDSDSDGDLEDLDSVIYKTEPTNAVKSPATTASDESLEDLDTVMAKMEPGNSYIKAEMNHSFGERVAGPSGLFVPELSEAPSDTRPPAPVTKVASIFKTKAYVAKMEQDVEEGEKKHKSKKSKKRSKGKKKAKDTQPHKTLAQLKKEGMRNAESKKIYFRRLKENWQSSAKVDKVMEILENIIVNTDEKTIIFSQFTSLLDLLEVPIKGKKWGFERYDGSMSSKARHQAIVDFETKAHSKLMLVSLKAGNAGLNLVCASQVIILDPFWNPYIEEQAIDRAHRIGQLRPVVVHKILVKETVEDRIVMLQEKKRAIIEGALDEKANKAVGRLGMAELGYLFGVGAPPAGTT
jgi:SNF2 family DNA or RNA helicase